MWRARRAVVRAGDVARRNRDHVVFRLTVPTEGGDEHIEDRLTFVYGVLDGSGVVGGTWPGEPTAGSSR